MMLCAVLLGSTLQPPTLPEPPVFEAGPDIDEEEPLFSDDPFAPTSEATGEAEPGADEPAELEPETWDTPSDPPSTALDQDFLPERPDLEFESPEPLPKQRGTGLLLGAGAAGLVGIGFNVWRARMFSDICALESGLARAFGCTIGAIGMFPLTAVTWTANIGSIGLAAAGGSLRGEYDGRSTIRNGEGKRTGIGGIAAGASLLAVGVGVG
jgi:hypothetical protein